MRTITLELLRHGPAHNQLLSPLTPYLALCENHGAVTLQIPFEHNQFLFRLRSLRYEVDEESRLFQLNDTARVLSEILAKIPGLTAESNKADGTADHLTHIRLIISASELALLPFELALSPEGMPGAGQFLLLQPQMPLCLTRETRRVPGEHFQWPKKPRILFIAAAPPKVGAVPLESHLLALRQAISPWVKYYKEDDPEMRRERVEDHLYFLPQASIESIERACATCAFTHIHILAHGVQAQESFDTRFFIALHNSVNPEETDYITGSRLATALRASQRPDSRGLSRPAVVTLASCDSGNVGSVAGAGASIAHALHEAGIPLVVAGQFPLSFEGSVRLVECLYEGLLWGTDPRRLLYDLRRRLYTQFRGTHDWASLTAYVSLPPDFDEQLPDVQINQVMRSINAAMNHADEATRKLFETRIRSKRLTEQQRIVTDEEKKALVKNAQRKMKEAKQRLERLIELLPSEKSRVFGLLASTEKRQAEILYSQLSIADPKRQTEDRNDCIELLRKARDHYWDSFLLKRSSNWAVVQYLSLSLVLKRLKPPMAPASTDAAPETEEKDLAALWSLSNLLSLYDLHSTKREEAIWAHGNLIELYLLSLLMPNVGLPDADQAAIRADEHTNELLDIADHGSFEVYSTRRQIFRYVQWFAEMADLAPLTALAETIFNKFPDDIEEQWQ